MKHVPIGRYLHLSRTRVEPDAAAHYQPIGIRSFGKGIIDYPLSLGAELSKVTYYRIPAGALLVSNIKGWEGAVGVSDQRHETFVASQRFLPYVPNSHDDVIPRFVYHYLLSDEGLTALGKASPGSADRNRTLGRAAFESIVIPLPDIEQQRAIAARLDSISGAVEAVTKSASRVEASIAALSINLFRREFSPVRLDQLLTESARFEPVLPSNKYPTAGVKWYAEGVFAHEAKPASEIRATKLNRLVSGEFIYNRLFAWKGSFALTSDEPLYVSNEFPTFTIDHSKVLPEYLLGWFSLPQVWDKVLRLSTGATPTSRNRLKQEQLLKLEIPLPSIRDQQSVVEVIRNLKEARTLNATRARVGRALPQAARNAEFARLMS